MITKIINKWKYWSQLLLLPVYWLSFLFPRNKKIWLFGSTFGRRFADNPKYFYLYMSQHREKTGIRPVWISHNREIVTLLCDNGYEAYYYHSLKGIWFALRGKVYLFDNYSKDINFWQSGGAVKVNLWHGVGNKKINHDNLHDKVRHPENLWERFLTFPRRLSDEKPSHYILATSPMMCEIFARAFQVPQNHVIEAGYPRNDFILGASIQNLYREDEKKVLGQIVRWKETGGVVDLYMPTFRESETKFFDTMDLAVFNTFLQENQILFVMKLHPKSKLQQVFSDITYSNIINLQADMDPYAFLEKADILTTDYSSVYSDFMLLDRPVVAFWYDFAEYASNTREGYFSFTEYMPEVQAENMDELMMCTKKVLQEDSAATRRKESRKKMFSSKKPDGCETLFAKISEITG
ncbi:MAG: CDP-glycerol glycerophosphotransferase family protein [Butyribacter sp.]|nr:CDP-glycerol glycerophosphotransferase family protein [bacterium]MDY3853702.1 CDP-glycerol glycerophosphotransferase family protein [Butyribacter sp.]